MDKRRAPVAVGLVAAGAVAGAVLAGTMSANAASDTGTATATPSGAASAPANQLGSTPVRSDEKAVSADVAAKLKAAALKAVPGGTVYRVETDADGDAYEAHMKKADGTLVTVKFDSSYTVTSVQDGMGAGGPKGGGQPGSAPSTGSTSG
jgi:hypothetical protein